MTALQVTGWRWSHQDEESQEFPYREDARNDLVEKHSLHPSLADKFVWPITLNVYGRDPA